MRNLSDLLTWLEYGRVSGYIAARESKAQEEHWAHLLRPLLARQDFESVQQAGAECLKCGGQKNPGMSCINCDV